MADSGKNVEKSAEFSGKTNTSSFFNRSMTMQGTPADSNPKVHFLLNSSFNRTTSISKFYNSIESVVSAGNSLKGKVKKLCTLFESGKSSKAPVVNEPQSQFQTQLSTRVLRPSRSIGYTGFPSFNNSLIRLPGTEDRIVVYFTSLRGIRRTYEDCYAVRMIFRGFGVWIDERDISMDSAYKKELQSVLREKNVSLPQVFIRGRYVGGADVIKSMFEVGELAKILEGFPRRTPGFVCQGCGDVRFIPCGNCSGSRKVFDEDEGLLKRCLECNENGLIRCPDCCS
ncbi:hypothetical protein SLEP1_g5203 [Rubroshorea leprosula]|uniref:Glutaredoxin domain-containing protein n=1 Tax=Rubroshorea leprosula TaxID=152421 RepID=A0AAV5I1S6_9ROSI|nr:hypothetical protein SLEP1_g5203 [Rubroshorea leprosula]